MLPAIKRHERYVAGDSKHRGQQKQERRRHVQLLDELCSS